MSPFPAAARGPFRVPAIEGFRAYLAICVLACHAMWYSGYEEGSVGAIARLILSGYYPVDVFIIISGFVIFALLDARKQTYAQFATQRFFRLFPLFITLFVAGILLYNVQAWNLRHIPYFTPDRVGFSEAQLKGWTDHLAANIALHATMLHGIVPDSVWKDAPGAFLVPAWSISLEWQFYLLAPLVYAMAIAGRASRLGLTGVCMALFLSAIYVLPQVRYGAFLPFHVEYFFIGAASWFIFAHVKAYRSFDTGDVCFPIAAMLALVIAFSARAWGQIPLMVWMLFAGLILEPASSYSSRLLMPLFENRVIQYLGRISYSIYLSHFLVLALVQYALLHALPGLSQLAHCLILFGLCITLTVALSAALYRFIEAPGIAYGKRLSNALKG